MARQEYLIEAMGETGEWYILGSDRLSHVAQHYMGDYRRMFPKLPLTRRKVNATLALARGLALAFTPRAA